MARNYQQLFEPTSKPNEKIRKKPMSNPKPNLSTRFAPGNTLGGRPKGARSRITEKFLQVLGADFDDHADEVIASVRSEDPAAYLSIVAKLLPKELEARVQVEQRLPGNLDPDDWATLRGVLDLIQTHAPAGVAPSEIFGFIEHALRSEFAKPVLAIDALAPPLALTPPPY
jgi:hypothetical protein